ncbi:MAG TPA: hypothetical protein VNJ01_00130 [Bacteriovoracaceae bacterium]|nr:hypothetical protein [Bacteriovoracaceae bacterium]
MTKIVLFFILSLPLLVHAGPARLADFATPFVKCTNASGTELVKVYDTFEGIAGIQVNGVDFMIDQRLKYMEMPMATVTLLESTPAVEIYKMSFRSAWNVDIRLRTATTYKTVLTYNGTKTTLKCQYARRQ